MVTGFSALSNGSPITAIGNPMSRTRSPPGRRQPRPLSLLVLLAIIVFAMVVRLWLVVADDNDVLQESSYDASLKKDWEEGLLLSQQTPLNIRTNNGRKGNDTEAIYAGADPTSSSGGSPRRQQRFVPTASIDSVIRYLTELAQLPPAQLWETFGMEESNYGNDPFSLKELDSGKCPWSSTSTSSAGVNVNVNVNWLPPRPFNSEELAKAYRSKMASANNVNGNEEAMPSRQQMDQYDSKNEVVIWYEHLSKAGGTTFCGLARSNMQMWQVPSYRCMPRIEPLWNGRPGSWPNEKLLKYVTEERHSIVSNEWDPFSLEKLKLSSRQLDGTPMKNNTEPGPPLLFLTTLRDPSDRLLSAYIFFVYTGPGKEETEDSNRQSFLWWIAHSTKRTRNFKVGATKAYRANVARYNHIVWRFSGGNLTNAKIPEEKDWKPAFETAIRALAQHDLVLPMDLMTKDETGKMAMQQLLGWNNFEAKGKFKGGDKKEGHVVTKGEVKNSNAREYFSEDAYRALWEGNWLDHILYLWCRAVFLARLHCKDFIAEP